MVYLTFNRGFRDIFSSSKQVKYRLETEALEQPFLNLQNLNILMLVQFAILA